MEDTADLSYVSGAAARACQAPLGSKEPCDGTGVAIPFSEDDASVLKRCCWSCQFWLSLLYRPCAVRLSKFLDKGGRAEIGGDAAFIDASLSCPPPPHGDRLLTICSKDMCLVRSGTVAALLADCRSGLRCSELARLMLPRLPELASSSKALLISPEPLIRACNQLHGQHLVFCFEQSLKIQSWETCVFSTCSSSAARLCSRVSSAPEAERADQFMIEAGETPLAGAFPVVNREPYMRGSFQCWCMKQIIVAEQSVGQCHVCLSASTCWTRGPHRAP